MLFWLLAAVLTAGVILWITRPLFRVSDSQLEPEHADVAVYRHQLEEVDADLGRGILNEAEADAARIEISRRLLQAAEVGDGTSATMTAPATSRGWLEPGRMATAICIGVVSLGGLTLYLSVGSPGLPDQPRAARLAVPANELTVGQLMLRVEARLREFPEDIRGWDVIAPIYLRQNRVPEAQAAYQRAITLGGETPARLSGLSRAKVRLSRNEVTDEIMAINRKIVAMVPFSAEAEFWIALGLEQRGKLAEARAAFANLMKPETIGQPWRPSVRQRIAAIDARLAGTKPAEKASETATKVTPGPAREDVEAAARMSPQARMEMIRGMVEGLAARLEEDGDDIAGWRRLIQAHVVMGEPSRAEAALTKAKAQFATDKTALASLDTLSQSLGLTDGSSGGAATSQTDDATEGVKQ